MKRTAWDFIRVFACFLFVFLVASSGHAFDRVETAGDVATVTVAAAAGLMTIGLQDTEGMIQLIKAATLDLTATMALKYVVKERRPNDEDMQSFPSAHSSVAFTSAEYLRARYGWEYGLPAYGIATFVAYSRVKAKKHYVPDVIAGAVIGIGSSYLYTTPNLRINLHAEIEPGYYGVRLTKAW